MKESTFLERALAVFFVLAILISMGQCIHYEIAEKKHYKYTIWVGSSAFSTLHETDTFNIDQGFIKWESPNGLNQMAPMTSVNKIVEK